MERYLIVKGIAGLGNRLLTISAAIAYAEASNRKLYVDWTDGLYDEKGVNPFYSLFQPNFKTQRVLVLDKIAYEGNFYPKIFHKENIIGDPYDLVHPVKIQDITKNGILNRFIKKYWGSNFWINVNYPMQKLGIHTIFNHKVCFPYGKFLKLYRKEQNIVYLDYIDNRGFDRFFKYFTFTPDLQIYGSNYQSGASIGVHVRHSDIKENDEYIHLLANVLKSQINKNEFCFLATDSLYVRQVFEGALGKSLIFNSTNLSNDSNMGLHNYLGTNPDKSSLESLKDLINDIRSLISVDCFYAHRGSTLSEFISGYRRQSDKPNSGYWQELVNIR